MAFPEESHALHLVALVSVVAAAVSLVITPLPPWLLIRVALLGAVVGALWLPRLVVLSWIGVGIMLLGVRFLAEAAAQRTPSLHTSWWEAPLIAWGVALLVVSLPALVRRFAHLGQQNTSRN